MSQCILPNTNFTSNVALQNNGNYSWTLPGAFNQGQMITINLTGQIAGDQACGVVGSYTNIATYAYTLVGLTHT